VAKHAWDARTYEALCLDIAPRMKALAARLTDSAGAAEDVFQEAVLRVWQQLPRLKNSSNLRGYFARVVANLSMDTHRRRRRENCVEVSPEELRFPPSDRDQGVVEDLAPELRHAISELPPQQREALVLRYFDELSYPELAELLGCSEVTARSHVSKAKTTLKRRLSRLPVFERFCHAEEDQ